MNSIKALAVLLGTIMGVGIFGLPYAASRSGFPIIFFYFILIPVLVSLIHSLYVRVIIGTENDRRLPGYVGEYLGSFWKKFIFSVLVFGMIGSSIAYIIIGGEFLNSILSPIFGGSPIIYSSLFFILGSVLVFKGIKVIANIEVLLSFLLVAILIFISLSAFGQINLSNLANFSPQFFLFPYGILIFSLWGSNAIPEVKEISGKKNLRKIVVSGVFISAILYLIFTITVLGICGSDVSKDAISGLNKYLGGQILFLGFLFGVISCFTSYITLSLAFKKTLWCDFEINKNAAWALACFIPFVLFLLGIKKFIAVISFTGAVSLGLESFVVIILYRAFLMKKHGRKINPLYYFLSAAFILGAIFEITVLF